MQDPNLETVSSKLTQSEKEVIAAVDRNPQLVFATYRMFLRTNRPYAVEEMRRLFLISPPAREDDGEVLTDAPGNPPRDFELEF